VPLDPAIRAGTLPNGISYFIVDGATLDPDDKRIAVIPSPAP